MPQSFPIRSRATTVGVVSAVHLLVLWAIWRTHPHPIAEAETFTTQIFFFDSASGRSEAPAVTAQRPPMAAAARSADNPPRVPTEPLVLLPQSTAPNNAITLPRAPAADIDWSGELKGAANATLAQEERAARQARALVRKYLAEDDPRNPHPGPASAFRWYDAGTHRFDTRGSLPVFHVNERCALLLFIIPACAIGHIEAHGDLFDGAALVHDEKLATPRPNDVP